jgi:hypothetical protein
MLGQVCAAARAQSAIERLGWAAALPAPDVYLNVCLVLNNWFGGEHLPDDPHDAPCK